MIFYIYRIKYITVVCNETIYVFYFFNRFPDMNYIFDHILMYCDALFTQGYAKAVFF